jgi:amino acid transporter
VATGQPWAAVIRNVSQPDRDRCEFADCFPLLVQITNSQAATIVLTILMSFQFVFTSINQATTSSRQLWAFARDKGVPFHRFLSRVGGLCV